jgi:hypothetical protein
MKLLTEYENLTQEVDVTNNTISWVTFSYSASTFIFSRLKIIAHEKPDNNLESHYISFLQDLISEPLPDIYKAPLVFAAYLNNLNNI